MTQTTAILREETGSLAPLELIDEAISLLDDERGVFLSGQYERLPELLRQKAVLLEQIENVIQSAEHTGRFVKSVKKLIMVSRRNEEIIRAAQQGLAHARRRLKAIEEMNDGVVAYSIDGSRISSHADQIKNRRTA